MIKSALIVGILFLTICVSRAFAQTNLYWTNYALYNPAATGMANVHDFSATTTFKRDRYWSQNAMYQGRIKALHGAIGVGGSFYESKYHSGSVSPMVNYSFHLQTGEETTLGFGANATYVPVYYHPNGDILMGLGTHIRHKTFNAGLSVQTYPKYLGQKVYQKFFTTLYADYVWNASEKFALHPSILIVGDFGLTTTVSVRGIFLQKYAIGASVSDYYYGATAGLNLGKHVSLSYGIEFNTGKSYFYAMTGQNRIVRNSINLRVFLSEKE